MIYINIKFYPLSTEIYTHVTTKGFDQIKSPLDTLDL